MLLYFDSFRLAENHWFCHAGEGYRHFPCFPYILSEILITCHFLHLLSSSWESFWGRSRLQIQKVQMKVIFELYICIAIIACWKSGFFFGSGLESWNFGLILANEMDIEILSDCSPDHEVGSGPGLDRIMGHSPAWFTMWSTVMYLIIWIVTNWPQLSTQNILGCTVSKIFLPEYATVDD